MALNNSGPLSIGGETAGQSINLELGRTATTTSNLGESALRTLAGVPTGIISISNFYGKANSLEVGATFYSNVTVGTQAQSLNAFKIIGTFNMKTEVYTGSVSSIHDGAVNLTTTAPLQFKAYMIAGLYEYTVPNSKCFGDVAVYTNKVRTYDYVNFTVANPVSGFVNTDNYNGAGNSTLRGYATAVNLTNTVRGVVYATNTLFTSGNLPASRYSGVDTATNGTTMYSGGGTANTGPTPDAVMWKMPFSTETWSNMSITLAVNRSNGMTLSSGTKFWYFGGFRLDASRWAVSVLTIDGTVYSTETKANPAATLTLAKEQTGPMRSNTAGYLAGNTAKNNGGGSNTSITTAQREQIEKWTYASEALSTITAKIQSGQIVDNANQTDYL